VRRITASLLLVLFSLSLIAPARVALDTDSKLPACCRRDGKHHCTQTTGSGFHAARCADFPSLNALPANQAPGLPGLSGSTRIALVIRPTRSSRLAARSLISYSQTGQKRGPPVLFS
jgi:hypothetical protein